MAIIYGKDTAKDYAPGNLASFGKSYSRMGAAPLDMTEVWYDKAALIEYASLRGTDAQGNKVYDAETPVTDTSCVVSYVGQKVVYVDVENNTIHHYSIGLNGELIEIDTTILNTADLDENAVGYIPYVIKVVDIEADPENNIEEEYHIEVEWGPAPEGVVTTVQSTDGSVTVTDNGTDGNHAYDLKVNFPAPPVIPDVESTNKAITVDPVNGHKITFQTGKSYVWSQAENKLVEATEDILAVGENGLDATVKVEYIKKNTASEGQTPVYDYGIYVNGVKAIDAADFIKDGFLDNVTYDENSNALTFVWNTDAGKQNLTVDIGEILGDVVHPVYEIGANHTADIIKYDLYKDGTPINESIIVQVKDSNSIDLYTDGDTITADVALDETTGGNILEVTEDGLYATAIQQVEGTAAIKATTNDLTATVELVIDNVNPGNVTLTQSEDGLKAEVVIPPISIEEAEDKTYTETKPQANTEKVIAILEAEDHAITPTVIDVVTKTGWDAIHTSSGLRLINQSEIDKLAKLNLDNGEITISGSVNASQVKELYNTVVDIVKGATVDLDPDTEGDQFGLFIERGAQVNKIESIGLPDATLAIVDKSVSIPYATKDAAGKRTSGAVIGSDAVNKIDYTNGVGEVNSLSTDKLVQGEMTLVLCGGDASFAKNVNA